jgi:hypothetical protein
MIQSLSTQQRFAATSRSVVNLTDSEIRRMKMNRLQKWGGFAALYQAAAYLWGIVFFLFIVNYPAISDPAEKLAFVVAHRINMQVTHLFMYVLFGIFLVVLVLALHERIKNDAPRLMMIATAFGLIWSGALIASGMIYNLGLDTVAALYEVDAAQAALVWLPFEGVSAAIGGGNGEILGGIWTLLVSWAALASGRLPKALNVWGVIVGAAGVLSTVPGLHDLGAIFGMSQIVWFILLGIVLLRSQNETTSGAK